MTIMLRQALECFFAGLSFYTRIPMPTWVEYKPENLNKSRQYLALIGVLVGCTAALVFALASMAFPSSISILLSIFATVYLTGAFHEDGFADSCDGFGGGWDKTQILSIMKDSRIGSYGVVGLLLLFMLKASTLWELSQTTTVSTVCLTLILAHASSRFMASLVMQYYAYVSHIETSKSHQVASLRLPNKNMMLSFLPIACFLFVLLEVSFFIAIITSLLLALLMGQYFKKRIGGYTGDCLGAVQQSTEVCVYLTVLALSS